MVASPWLAGAAEWIYPTEVTQSGSAAPNLPSTWCLVNSLFLSPPPSLSPSFSSSLSLPLPSFYSLVCLYFPLLYSFFSSFFFLSFFFFSLFLLLILSYLIFSGSFKKKLKRTVIADRTIHFFIRPLRSWACIWGESVNHRIWTTE